MVTLKVLMMECYLKLWMANFGFKLNNKYWYHYAYNPEVVIYQKNGKYILSVADQEIQVL